MSDFVPVTRIEYLAKKILDALDGGGGGGGFTPADEGKVVHYGALVSQSSAEYTENGTYDTTMISSVEVDVPQGVLPLYIVPEQTTTSPSTRTSSLETADIDIPDLTIYDGVDFIVTVNGQKYTMPAHWDDNNNRLIVGDDIRDYSRFPVCISLAIAQLTGRLSGLLYMESAYTNYTVSAFVWEEAVLPAGEIEITQNGTYDVTEYARVIIAVE